MSPAPADYVDVSERIRTFYERYPDGSLQMWSQPELMHVGDKTYIRYVAAAYRTPDDKCPGIGCAWEPVPGPTPFTRDSELQNAETSAWGRAIVACGFETKHVASRDEVENRQAEPESEFTAPAERPQGAAERPASKGTMGLLKQHIESLQKGFPSPDPDHRYQDDARRYAQSEFGKTTEFTESEAQQLVREFDRRLVEAQQQQDIPFG